MSSSPARRPLLAVLACTLVLTAGAAGCSAPASDRFEELRMTFIEEHLGRIRDPRVIDAFRAVRRERYCLPEYRDQAYGDHPLPIGHGQTISQPSLVAYMTEALELQPGEKVLEIGTGSGYQAAILAEMGAEVYTIEIIDALARQAEQTLREEGYGSVRVRAGDGYAGWPGEAPFDAIILTAAPPRVPPALLDQLRPDTGRLLVPEGPQGLRGQTLRLYRKSASGAISSEELLAVRFVPMVREDPDREGRQ